MTSECSTAYNVWKSQKSPARALVGAALIGQNGLAPHPAARQGASRARNCAAISVFSFDGSTAVFFLGRQKENGGGKPQAFACTPGWSTGQHGGVRLGCGFRQPNSETEFGASVMVTPPYGSTTGGTQQRADVGIGPYRSITGGVQRRTAGAVVPYGCPAGPKFFLFLPCTGEWGLL